MVGVVLLGGPAPGCGPTATILRNDGPNYEAEIVDSEPDALFVRGGRGGKKIFRVEREDIRGIDHPGDVGIVAGGLLLAPWLILMSRQNFRDELVDGPRGDVSVAARPLTILFALPAIVAIATGIYYYSSSKRAARAFER